MLEQFDLVITIGVVEHFDELSRATNALAAFLKPGGLVYTQIPNLSSSVGRLCKLLNKPIYELHNPHNLSSLVTGHEQAGLTVLESSPIGSTGFHVLSACLDNDTTTAQRLLYYALVAVTRATDFWESSLFPLPRTQALSPLLYCIGKKD